MRLIDADALKRNILCWKNCYNGYSDAYDKSMIIGAIEEMPTVDAEPIRHGHWRKVDDKEPLAWDCSVCGAMCHYNTPYCPICGAKMDEE